VGEGPSGTHDLQLVTKGTRKRQKKQGDRAGGGCNGGERHHQEDHGRLKSLPGDVDGSSEGEHHGKVHLGDIIFGGEAA